MAKRIGELLVEGGVLSQSQLEQALFAQRKDGRKLGQLLVELGFVGEIQVTQTLSRQLSVPWVSLYHVDFSRSLLNLVPRELAEQYCLVPIFVRRVRKQGETLYVAMDDPTNEAAIREVHRAAMLPVKPMIACPGDIRAAIRVYYFGEAPPAPASRPELSAGPDAEPSPPPPPAPSTTQLAQRPGSPQAPAAGEPVAAIELQSVPPSAEPREDAPGSAPDIEATEREIVAPQRKGPRMVALTLLDGTTISLPAPKKKAQADNAGPAERVPGLSEQLTARDFVSALRALSHGAEASEVLGNEPRWEALFAALLSILLRKGLIADWEFIEELRKV